MVIIFLWQFLAGQGFLFSNATVYDTNQKVLHEGRYLLVNGEGQLEAVGLESIPLPAGAKVIEDALIVPHLSDFYSLLQERGLGFDQDFEPGHLERMANAFLRLGIGAVRDPVFPPQAVTPALDVMEVYAQRGYLALQGGAGARFGLVLDPEEPLNFALERVPAKGPITLWWTSRGTSDRVRWNDHVSWLDSLLEALRARGQKVGAFVEGATSAELQALREFSIDFLEGVPTDFSAVTVANFPNTVWVPLLALNDKRYCAKDLEARMIAVKPLELYDFPTLERARGMVRQVQASMLDRCKVWQKQRPEYFAMVGKWIEAGGKVAVGSAGGHPFSFSGELHPEIELLQDLGMDSRQTLEALFMTTPLLMGVPDAYLRIGKPAHFIVYTGASAKDLPFGKAVSMNFSKGILTDVTSMKK